MLNFEYKYKAVVVDVYDGDTVKVDIDLGFNLTFERTTLRLARINAPELRGSQRPEGLKSRDRLRDLVLNKEIVIKTIKDKKGKYGRYIAELIDITTNKNINDQLVEEGLAVYKDYS